MTGAGPTLALRPARDDDAGFLARLYASTRADDPVLVAFEPRERESFLAQQFAAQKAHYEHHFAKAAFDLVLADGERAGRLIVLRSERKIRIVDISLLPEWRSRGIGGRLIAGVIAPAEAEDMTVVLTVAPENPAVNLYLRHGFVVVGGDGVYLSMERPPAGDQVKTAS